MSKIEIISSKYIYSRTPYCFIGPPTVSKNLVDLRQNQHVVFLLVFQNPKSNILEKLNQNKGASGHKQLESAKDCYIAG